MRTVQEEALANYLKKLRKHGTYNRKWWNPLPFSMYIHDLLIHEQITSMVEVGTGNGVTAAWGSLAGASVWTCDTDDRPKIWDEEKFPLPHLKNRIHFDTELGHDFLYRNLCMHHVRHELIVLDGPTHEKGFRRLWESLNQFVAPDDIIVSPIGHAEIYTCWQKIANAGFKVMFNSSTESFTLKWPNDGNLRDW